MRTVTLESLKTRSRERADMVGSNFVSDEELTGYINASITELYDLLVTAYGEDYFVGSNPYSFTTESGTDTYDLPPDFYKLIGVDVQVNGSDWMPVKKYDFLSRNRGQEGYSIHYVMYRLIGSKIRFTPTPHGSHNVRLWYIPVCNELSEDEDTFDGINGWEEYVIVDVAIKMLQKEESDVSVLLLQKEKLEKRIESMKEARDAGEPEKITDIYGPDYEDEWLSVGAW